MAIDLSRQAESDSMFQASEQSKLLALDAEQIAEAVAWSFEHPSPKQEGLVDRLKDVDKVRRAGDNYYGYNDGTPTLLAGRRALLAKGSPEVFGSSAQLSWNIGEEAVRRPLGDASNRAEEHQGPGPRGILVGHRNRASVEMEAAAHRTHSRVSESSRHSYQSRECLRAVSRGDSRGTDWSAIIGPESGQDVSHPTQQVTVSDMKLSGTIMSESLTEEASVELGAAAHQSHSRASIELGAAAHRSHSRVSECSRHTHQSREAGYVPELDRNCSEAAISILEVDEESEEDHERYKV